MSENDGSGAARRMAGRVRGEASANLREAGFVVVIDECPGGRAELLERLMGAERIVAGVESAAAYWDRYGDEAGCVVAVHRRRGEGAAGLLSERKRRGVGAPVVILIEESDVTLAVQLMRSGAFLVGELSCTDAELRAALDQAAVFDTAQRAEVAAQDALASRFASLSDSEHEVLRLILDGLPNKAIARKMELSLRTVENRRRNIYDKFGVENVARLVAEVCSLPNWRDLA